MMKKLNTKGFGHIELLVIIVTIVVIGGIGSYAMLRRSHADALVGDASTCGSGYSLYKSKAFTTSGQTAQLRVYRKGTATLKDWCVMTVHTGSSVGKKLWTDVKVQCWQKYDSCSNPNGGSDSGTYGYYAGPVKLRAASLYFVSGQIANSSNYATLSNLGY